MKHLSNQIDLSVISSETNEPNEHDDEENKMAKYQVKVKVAKNKKHTLRHVDAAAELAEDNAPGTSYSKLNNLSNRKLKDTDEYELAEYLMIDVDEQPGKALLNETASATSLSQSSKLNSFFVHNSQLDIIFLLFLKKHVLSSLQMNFESFPNST